MALMEVRDLEKTYQDEDVATRVLKCITLDISECEFLAIMGPSGSGKSTLLHILGFLDRYSEGTYFFEGKEMSEYSETELAHTRNKKMGFVFQSFNLLSRTPLIENVKLPLLYSHVPESHWRKMAMDAIEAVGLEHRLNHHPAPLSGGEKQRAAIARALVLKPDVIFADEPTGNLDSRSGQLVMETLQHLNEAHGHTIVLITHETYTAEHAHRIIHIKDGTVDKEETVRRRHRATEHFEK